MIFERWILAADRLGPLQSGMASYMVNDLAHVLSLCEQTALAQDLQSRGPLALTSLSLEERSALAGRVEPTLRPSVKSLLQVEAVEMERAVATEVPCRLLVLGKAAGGEALERILKAEFPRQRGSVVSLERPSPSGIALFDQSRHQLLWPERAPVSDKPPPSNVERVRFPASEPPPGQIWNLNRLAGLNPAGLFYSSFASKPMVGFEPSLPVRYGALTLLGAVGDDLSPGRTADVLFASAVRTIAPEIPIAFLRPFPGESPEVRDFETGERVRVFLGDARESYGRIDFDPQDRSVAVSVFKSKTRAPVASMSLKLPKDRLVASRLTRLTADVQEALAETIQADLRGSNRRARALRQAREIVAITYPMACRYVEWIERHPEAPVFEREKRLTDLEVAMTQDVPPALAEAGHAEKLLRRDLFKTFEHFLTGWGLRHPS
ncbi:MAG TPA: hypothetical protein VFX30_08585 [bacterium]|nr:hypothetical protein [bacterium]